MKRLITAVTLVLCVITLGAVRVGITQIVDHPALNAVFDGIVKVLEDAGFKVGQDVLIDRQNAQGSMQNAVAIAKKFATEKVDIVVAIATPSAQACVQAITDRPVIFSAVTDPVGAGLIKQLGKNTTNVVGVSDMVPVATQLRLIKKIFPNAKKVGVIFNPGEANSVTLNNIAKSAAPSLEMTIAEIPGTSPSEMITALNSIGPSVDVLYIGTDNTAASSIEAIGNAALRLKKPIVAADIDIARGGGVVGFGFNYFQVGVETGQLLVELLKGAKPSDLESHVVGPDSLVLYINLDIAKQLGVEIPADLVDRADIVVRDGQEVAK
ncbi:ABC transporter substrate-binding protein [Pseudothermotoga sp. U03pept]|uniref:ABC transporter substrate-binding protein n=1 Tax=Pseudothermotoga sp. U03pept TaxID=3447012 RepID=UPI003F009DCF